MLSSLGTMLLAATLGYGPYDYGPGGCATCGSGYGYYAGMPAGGYYGGAAAVGAYPYAGGAYAGGAYGSGSSMDQHYPYDAPDPWMHGYFQEMPAYGGFRYFRPYNYKHALAQSTTAGQWGISPVMPYSQQFWHRYQDKASLNPQAAQNAATSYNAEYTRELARLKAWQDFQVAQGRAPYDVQPAGVQPLAASPYATAPAAQMLGGAAPQNAAAYPGYGAAAAPNWQIPPSPQWPATAAPTYPMSADPRYANSAPRFIELPPPPTSMTAPAYPSPSDIDRMQQRLQEQARQIQVLENTLNQRTYQPPVLNVPSGWNAPYGY